MKRTKFDYEVKVELEVTWAEFQNMWACSRSHYDFYCKGLSEQGGVLFGLRNRFFTPIILASEDEKRPSVEDMEKQIKPDDVASERFTRRQLDLLAKTLENPPADMNLYYGVRQILRDVDDECSRLYGEEPPKRGPILHASIESKLAVDEFRKIMGKPPAAQ